MVAFSSSGPTKGTTPEAYHSKLLYTTQIFEHNRRERGPLPALNIPRSIPKIPRETSSVPKYNRRETHRMYVPAAFAEPDRTKLHEFMRRNSFATLVSQGEGGLSASHLPLLLDSEAGATGHLLGHMARANDQWRRCKGEMMAVFSGPHAYISPSWYEEPGTVPTWNYVAVHAYGRMRVVDDPNGLLDILRRSVLAYEGSRSEPWTFNESEPHVEKLLQAIVGFRIEIDRLEGKWKLGQNQTEGRRRKVIRVLESRPDEDARAIASLMSETMPGSEVRPG